MQYRNCINLVHFCSVNSVTDGADYTGGLLTAKFNGSNTTSVPVSTLSNEIAERIESFTAIVKVPANATRVSRMNASDIATVQIKDDDGKFLLLIHVVAYCCQTIHVHSFQFKVISPGSVGCLLRTCFLQCDRRRQCQCVLGGQLD